MQYYHDLVTRKSWEELLFLQKNIRFVLIGEWATYLYAHTLKSKDIDIVIDYDQLPLLAKHYQLFKNERLHKYEAIKEEVQIDIYLPHMAELGMPAEEIIKQTCSLEGFTVVEINLLFALKLHVLRERGRTPKGRKDFLDLLSLFLSGKCNTKLLSGNIKQYNLQAGGALFAELLKESTQIPELGLNQHRFAKIKAELGKLLD
jgi:hypothetical protein